MRGITYCRQIASRTLTQTAVTTQDVGLLTAQTTPALYTVVRNKADVPPYKFSAPSPYRKPGPSRYGYQQKMFDGGRLPRGLSEPLYSLKPYKPKNVWNRKRALFGQNDYIDILGDSDLKPADLIKAPAWLKGFYGNELQRVVRRLHFEGHVIKQLYPTFYHNHWKRIRYLYKKYNQRRGKRH